MLEFDVLTTQGKRVIANATQNEDLFFALRGGVSEHFSTFGADSGYSHALTQGGGTYGIVWSVTIKTHPDMPVAGASVVFGAASDGNFDTWYQGVEAWFQIQPSITAAGGYALTFYQNNSFALWPLLLPGSPDTSQIEAILAPFLSKLAQLGLPYQANISSYSNFYSAFTALSNPAFFAVQNAQLGGRIIPKSVYADPQKLSQYSGILKSFLLDGAGIFDFTMTPKDVNQNTALLPSWRTSQTSIVVFLYVLLLMRSVPPSVLMLTYFVLTDNGMTTAPTTPSFNSAQRSQTII